MNTNKQLIQLAWILRIGIAMTFIGHGMFAISGKPNWLPYLEVVGFPLYLAERIIVYIGYLDLLVALFILYKPYRGVVIWAFIWTLSTALIRPISGEPIWDFVERGANWAAPLALLFILKHTNQKVHKQSISRAINPN